MSEPISPPPLRDYRPEYLPAYIGNGLLGLRCGRIPFLIGTAMVNGFAGIDPGDGVEGFSPVPYPIAADVAVDGIRLSTATDRVRFVEQRYDFSTAELTTVLEFKPADVTARIDVVAFCSRTYPTVVLQEVRVTLGEAADLQVSIGVDPDNIAGVPEFVPHTAGRDLPAEPDGLLVWHGPGEIARCGIAYRSELADGVELERRTTQHDERGMLSTTYAFRADAGRAYPVRQMTSLVPSLAHPHPADHAARLLALSSIEGWDGARMVNRGAWRERWRSRIVIDGATPRWQAITDASLFYLLTSVHPGSVAGTSLFGLAYWPNYHYYRGHVMWDIESFIVPPLVLLDPESAASILDFRVRHLEEARANARLAGWRGAMYPWESCTIHGEEVTPGATAPTRAHASFSVALALAGYTHATGRLDRFRRWGWPVIEAVAEFTESRVVRSARGFELRGTIGAAELDHTVDNDAYVNMAAARTLREATALARQLGEEPPATWTAIADGLVLPQASTGEYVANHDGHRLDDRLGDTPEAAAGIFPVGYRLPKERELATLRYAVERQAPTYVGTPMLSGFLAVYAAWAGLRPRTEELLERGYGDFIDQPFWEPDEFTRRRTDLPRAAPMFANIGAYLSSLLFGFPGIRLGPGPPTSWFDRPVALPWDWRSIHVERLWVRGEERSLTAADGERRARFGPPSERRAEESRDSKTADPRLPYRLPRCSSAR